MACSELTLQAAIKRLVLIRAGHRVIIPISYKSKGIIPSTPNLSRMLEFIEKHVLQGIHWQRKESDIEALLNRYEQLKKFGVGLEFIYYLSSLQGQELNNIKQAIQREGSIRLFDCKFEDKAVN